MAAHDKPRHKGACSVCSHPDRATIDEQLAAGATYSDIARRYRLNISPVSNHYRKHTGATVPTTGVQSDSVKKAKAHLSDLEDRIETATDPDIKVRLLAERGRALAMLSRLKGDALQTTVTTFVTRLGFSTPEDLEHFVSQSKAAASGGTAQMLALAQRVLAAWNAAHPDDPREVTAARRTRYVIGPQRDTEVAAEGAAASGDSETRAEETGSE